jgi:[ribosomal protein S5]-alanine N-acetyltransferase
MDIVMSEFLLYIKAGFLGDKWNTFLNVRKERMHQMNNVSPLLKGKNVILRKPKDSDVNDYLACKQTKELIRMYGGDTRNLKPLTLQDAKRHVEYIKSQKLNWCIEYEQRFVGEARLTVNEYDRRARYAIGLFDSSVWNQGLGTEVTKLVLAYAFEYLHLHRVDLRVLEYNHRAIACYEKCGFVKEGIEREGAFIEEAFQTDLIMSILEQEYYQL